MNPRLQEFLPELKAWWPSETEDFRGITFRFLASLVGGETAEALGFEPFQIGWKEVELIGKLLTFLEDSSDVEEVIGCLSTTD